MDAAAPEHPASEALAAHIAGRGWVVSVAADGETAELPTVAHASGA